MSLNSQVLKFLNSKPISIHKLDLNRKYMFDIVNNPDESILSVSNMFILWSFGELGSIVYTVLTCWNWMTENIHLYTVLKL